MFGVLALFVAALAVWLFFSPTRHFLRGFAQLLDTPRPHAFAPNPFATSSLVAGSYSSRRVQLRLEHPTEDDAGRIVLEVQVRAPDGAPWKDTSVTAHNSNLSRATFDLEGRYELILTLTDGWLRAESMSAGLFFPGSFDERRWRNTLAQMHVLASWLEGRSA